MRRHKLFLTLCMAGLCLISFLHFLKALSYVTFPRDLASLSPNLVSSFFWNNAPVTPQVSPEPGGAEFLRTPLYSHSPLLQPLPPSRASEELHKVEFVLPEDTTEYFVRTKAGGVCFKPGTKVLEKPPAGGLPHFSYTEMFWVGKVGNNAFLSCWPSSPISHCSKHIFPCSADQMIWEGICDGWLSASQPTQGWMSSPLPGSGIPGM